MCCSYLSELQSYETGGEKLYTCPPLLHCVISKVDHNDVTLISLERSVSWRLAYDTSVGVKDGIEQFSVDQLDGCTTSLAVSAYEHRVNVCCLQCYVLGVF